MVKLWRDQWGTTFAVDEAWVTERVAETFTAPGDDVERLMYG